MQYPFSSARFIWHPEGSAINETMEFIKEFQIQRPSDCRLYIHVNSHYAIYINDQLVANDQYPDYEHYRVYDEIDLSSFVITGINHLRITAYCQGEDSSTYRAYPAELIYAINENNAPVAVSDETTLIRRDIRYASAGVAKVSGQLSYSFDYNAALSLGSYIPACCLDVHCQLHPRPIQKLQLDPPEPAQILSLGHFSDPAFIDNYAIRMQRAAITSGFPTSPLPLPCSDGHLIQDNWILIDLGKEHVGYFYLDIDLPCETDVLIGWGEHLDDLRVRTAVGARNFAARFHGQAGRNTFFYPIKRLGLRYLQLHVYAPSFTLYYAGICPARYPLSTVHLFNCADHLHAQIYRTSLRTLQGCMHEHYEDCPWREQALYTMDSRNQMLCGYYAFDEYDFPKSSLKLMGLSLRPDHLLELTSPAKCSITIPSFSAIYLIQLAEYLKYSGDLTFAREMLPIAKDIADGFINRIENNGLIRRLNGEEYWNFYEWQTGLEGDLGHEDANSQSAFDAPLSAFVSLGLQHLSAICEALELSDDAMHYQHTALSLNKAIHDSFFDKMTGCYATILHNDHISHYAELTQALVLLCGAVPTDCRDRVLQALAGQTELTLYPITLSHSIFKYEALMQYPNHYARLVFNQIAAEFGSMLYRNATTFWETLKGAVDFELAGSLCHGWSAIPVYFYMKYIIDSKQEGSRLSSEITGIYEPSLSTYTNASRNILDDSWC